MKFKYIDVGNILWRAERKIALRGLALITCLVASFSVPVGSAYAIECVFNEDDNLCHGFLGLEAPLYLFGGVSGLSYLVFGTASIKTETYTTHDLNVVTADKNDSCPNSDPVCWSDPLNPSSAPVGRVKSGQYAAAAVVEVPGWTSHDITLQIDQAVADEVSFDNGEGIPDLMSPKGELYAYRLPHPTETITTTCTIPAESDNSTRCISPRPILLKEDQEWFVHAVIGLRTELMVNQGLKIFHRSRGQWESGWFDDDDPWVSSHASYNSAGLVRSDRFSAHAIIKAPPNTIGHSFVQLSLGFYRGTLKEDAEANIVAIRVK